MTSRGVAAAMVTMALVAACSDNGSAADNVAAFCAKATAAKASADVQQKLFDIEGSPVPQDVQAAVEDFGAKFAAMTAVAPADIKDVVGAVNATAQELLRVVRANNYDVVKMIATPDFKTLSDTLTSDQYQSAQDSFQHYVDTNCGVTTTPGT